MDAGMNIRGALRGFGETMTSVLARRHIHIAAAVLLLAALAVFYAQLLPVGTFKYIDEYWTLDRSASFAARNDWSTVHSENLPNFNKPPLQYWWSASAVGARARPRTGASPSFHDVCAAAVAACRDRGVAALPQACRLSCGSAGSCKLVPVLGKRVVGAARPWLGLLRNRSAGGLLRRDAQPALVVCRRISGRIGFAAKGAACTWVPCGRYSGFRDPVRPREGWRGRAHIRQPAFRPCPGDTACAASRMAGDPVSAARTGLHPAGLCRPDVDALCRRAGKT